MPHEIFHNPDMDLSRSIGWLAIDWIEQLCVRGNGPVIGQQVKHLIDDYARFVAMTYTLDEVGNLLHVSAFLSRSKGFGKSEIAAYLALFDSLGPSRFDHFAEEGEKYVCPYGTGYVYHYSPGEPVGKHMATPIILCVATEEGQAGEIFGTIHLNCKEGPLSAAFPSSNDVGLTRIVIPGGGIIKPVTASGDSRDGSKPTMVCGDESHLWKTPELHNVYKTLSRSLLKRRKEGTLFVETSTMFGVGEGSVAEQAYDAIQTIREGKFKGRIRQVFDHRYGDLDPEDLGDPDKVRQALTEAYGEALEWNDLDGMVEQVMDIRDGADISATYRYWFNSRFGVSDSFLLSSQWQSCGPSGFNDDETDTKNYFPTPPQIQPGDTIVMGFDGSRKRQRGITDSTALVGCRVKDGVLFLIDVWEQPVDYHGTEGWEVDASVVDIAVRKAFKDYRVVGFYADPSMYTPWVAQWESRYGPSLKVKATQQHPIEYWFGGSNVGKKIVKAIDDFEDAVINRELKHFNNLTMTQHILNCRRKETSAGRQLGKETPSSPKKIDVAIAAIIAWQARLDAVSKGLATTKKRTAYRLR